MRKLRKTTAFLMTMSLAVSTIFGGIAWAEPAEQAAVSAVGVQAEAEMEGSTEKNTPSEAVRAEEKNTATGIYTPSEAGNGNSHKNTDKKEWDETKDVSLATPSEATPSEATKTQERSARRKVTFWQWYDPEEYLTENSLVLSGVRAEDKVSFEVITEMLPKLIVADVEDDEDTVDINIQSWICPEYVQDEEGNWPLTGEFVFHGVLPEEYVLAGNVDSLDVKVVMDGGIALLAAETSPLYMLLSDGKELYYYPSRGNITTSEYSITKMSTDVYKLELTNARLKGITISGGTWTINLNGKSTVSGGTTKGLFVYRFANVTIQGDENAQLYLTSGQNGINVYEGGTLNIAGGNIIAGEGTATGGNNGTQSAIWVGTTGTLNITGGTVKCEGDRRYGITSRGTTTISGGEVNGGKIGIEHTEGTFNIRGGQVTSSTVLVYDGLNMNITEGASLRTDYLKIGRNAGKGATLTIENGTVQVDGTIENKGTLEIKENGKLILNGTYDSGSSGSVINNGTLSGTGTVPDNMKQDREKITVKNQNPTAFYGTSDITVSAWFNIPSSIDTADVEYEIDGTNSTGEGSLTGDKLTATKTGTFKIRAHAPAKGVYKETYSDYLTLTVTKAELPDNIQAVAYKGTFDAKSHDAVTVAGIPQGENLSCQYRVSGESTWESSCPQVRNAADSGMKYEVKISGDNYADKVIETGNMVEISSVDFRGTYIWLTNPATQPDYTYDRKPHIGNIDNISLMLGATRDDAVLLIRGVDYELFWYRDGEAVEADDCIDAGTYEIVAGPVIPEGGTRKANLYNEKTTNIVYRIEPRQLTVYKEMPSVKVYDGTDRADAFELILDGQGITPKGVTATAASFVYDKSGVSASHVIAEGITLSGEQSKNYTLKDTRYVGTGKILPAEFASVTVEQAEPWLTYDGTEQQAAINTAYETGLAVDTQEDVSFLFSTEENGTYEAEMPKFKDAGVYKVYYKTVCDNFKEVAGSFEVKIQKAQGTKLQTMAVSYPANKKGETRISLADFSGLPDGGSNLVPGTAAVTDDEGSILQEAVRTEGNELVITLSGNTGAVGKKAIIAVSGIETKNYKDMELAVEISMTKPLYDRDSSSTGSDDDVTGEWSGTTAGGSQTGTGTNDSQPKTGTGAGQKGQTNPGGLGASALPTDAQNYRWELRDGIWRAYGDDGLIRTGWIYDTYYDGWFYTDGENGMKDGWIFLGGKWYYLQNYSDGRRGILYINGVTPDGWFVGADGSWDGMDR